MDGMTNNTVSCSMCGYEYNPDNHGSCASCPLKSGCQLSCCPQCGYETVDPRKSTLSRWLSRLFSAGNDDPKGSRETSLANIAPGCLAEVIGFDDLTPLQRKAHLQAYGLSPGHTVKVLQHKPVTVVGVDHLELALENELAQKILVTERK